MLHEQYTGLRILLSGSTYIIIWFLAVYQYDVLFTHLQCTGVIHPNFKFQFQNF